MKRHKEGYDARLDDSLGKKHPGPHKQSYAQRRAESKGEMKHLKQRPYHGDKKMK